MNKEDWKRLWMHFPIGAIAALVQLVDVVTGLTILALTITYEAFNDWRKHDESYKDILGIVWGYAWVAVIIIIVRWLI